MTTQYLTFKELEESTKRYNENNDCAVKAVAQACGVSYEKAHNALRIAGRKFGDGTYEHVTRRAMLSLGFSMKETKLYGKTIQNVFIPRNKIYLIQTASHILAARDGKALDYTAGRRHRPKSFYEVTKTHEAEDVEEKVIGYRKRRASSVQRRYTYACDCGCEYQLSQTRHNKSRRGTVYYCRTHKKPISLKTGESVKPNQPSWIKPS